MYLYNLISRLSYKTACLLICMAGSFCSIAQNQPDSTHSSIIEQIQKIGKDEAARSITKYEKGKRENTQRRLLEEIRMEMQKAGLFLKQTGDTTEIIRNFKKSKRSFEIMKDGIFINQGTHHTQRNLAVSDAILEQISISLENHRKKLDAYFDALSGFRFNIDSLSGDSIIYQFPSDSIEIVKYLKTMIAGMKEVAPLDTQITVAGAGVQQLLQDVDLFAYEVHTARNDIEKLSQQLSGSLLDREFPNLWEEPKNKRPIKEIINTSVQKEKLALQFYVQDNAWRILLVVVLLIIVTFFLDSLRHRLKANGNIHPSYDGQLVIKAPVLSAIVITFSLFQFIFLDPPFIFSFFLWIASAISLTLLFHRFITGFWMSFWITIVVTFTIACCTNMLLQASRLERWGMLALQLFGVLYATYILNSRHKKTLREKKILYFIAIFAFIELFALLFNMFGRYNLSKTLLVIGYTGLVIAILFLWTVRLLNEGLGMASEVYQHPDKKLFYINFDKVGNKVPSIFYVFLIAGWIILMGRHFYAFRKIASPLNDFLNDPRTIGDYTFSINGIFIFVLILVCSLFLSRLISFFAAEPDPSHAASDKKNKVEVGSWLLLIRIIIISFGLFLAIAAAGIPLDRITLIIGALGVGIGLGLQALVNNLVSGLIIAFEKPVNVGDLIEVDGKTGVMKSIGFRSSVVLASDGSSLIIPNGDLLSQHLVNWTMSKNRRRINIVVGVAYGTDLNQAQNLMLDILKAEDRIASYPPPVVFAREFGPSAIELDVFFWVADLYTTGDVKSMAIRHIAERFKEAGIVIPVPQQEILVRTKPTDPEQS